MRLLVRDALRHVLTSRRSSISAALVLAIGIGAGAAMYALLDKALIERLPYSEPDRLVQVWATDLQQGILESGLSFQEYLHIIPVAPSLETVGFYSSWTPSLNAGGKRFQTRVARASPELFEVLGVPPISGDVFSDASQPYIILSHSLAVEIFGRVDQLPEQQILLDGLPHVPLGVMPAGFEFPSEARAWVPARSRFAGDSPARDGFVVGRLAPNASIEQLQEELVRASKSIGRSDPNWTAERGLRAVEMQQQVGAPVRNVVLFLFVAVSVFFLIACASAGQLLYLENLKRRREWAVRVTLGARHRALIAQVVLEAVLISAAATLAGVFAAHWLIEASKALIAPDTPLLPSVVLNARALWFLVGAGAISAAAVGAISGSRVGRGEPADSLRESPFSTGKARDLPRSALLVAGTAIVVVLTVGAVSLASGLWKMTHADLGFRAEGVYTSKICSPSSSVSTEPAFFSKFSNLREVSAFQSVAVSDQLPIGAYSTYGVLVDGTEANVRVQSVSGSYFRTLGIPLLEGDTFSERVQGAGTPRQAIVTESFRNRFWPGTSPIGRRILAAWGDDAEWATVVGMVGNVRRSPTSPFDTPQIFVPFFREPQACATLLMNSDRPLSSVIVRQILWTETATLPYTLSDVTPLNGLLRAQLSQPRLRAGVIGGFAFMALLFGGIALYATLSHTVFTRRQELAVRAALGARRGDLARVIVRTQAGPIGLGLLVGVAASAGLASWTEAAVYGFHRLDLNLVLAVVAVLGITSLCAIAVPAWKAEQLDLLHRLKSS